MRHSIITAALLACCLASCASAQAPVAEDAPPLIPADVQVETVAEGFKFTEGPALAPNGSIYFTDIPNNRIHRFDPETGETTIALENSGGANGLAFEGDSLYACQGSARVVGTYRIPQSVFPDEDIPEYIIIAKEFEGGKLNSPNDLVIDRARTVYFTDPRYGNRKHLEQRVEAVYCHIPFQWDGMSIDPMLGEPAKTTRLIDNLVRPNGIGLSPDEKTLYVNDNGAKKIMAYPLLAPGKVGEGRVLYDTDTDDASGGGPDGMCVDHAGRLYVAIFDAGGILVLSSEGQRLGFIATGPQTTNCTFGADGRTLYVTADKSLKRVVLDTHAPDQKPSRRREDAKTQRYPGW